MMADTYWVEPSKLLGMRKPANLDEVAELKTAGVGGIISLLDDRENLDMYGDSPIEFCWVPVKGGTAPTPEQVAEAGTFADAIHQQGKAVAIHCTGGKKRTGTLIAALLVRSGLSADDALAQLAKANPDIALSELQVNFLKDLAR